MNWLKKDAINRLWRTFYHAIGYAIVASVLNVAEQVLDRLLSDTVSGVEIDWSEVWLWTRGGLVAAVIMPIIAYLHRKKLDPSGFPSAEPPRPPGVTGVQAPATTPTSGVVV